MSKTKLTLEIENKLRERAKNNSERYAFEVPIKAGIVDFITSKIECENHYIPHITCYEIKISFSDFKSENGHNLYGDSNYYVIPSELLDEIIQKNQNGRLHNVGVIVYKNGKLRKKTDGKRIYHTVDRLSIEDKFKIIDQMLMRVLYTGK